jgi:hypothetical protein
LVPDAEGEQSELESREVKIGSLSVRRMRGRP